jgi:3-oxoacyl-[acyl-carrier-protein] synthase II
MSTGISKRRVLITGMGLVSPLSDRVDEFWDRLLLGHSGVRLISSFSTEGIASKVGGECLTFDASRYIDRKAIKRLDRFAQFAICAAADAAKDSGLDFDRLPGERLGSIIGSGIGGLAELEEQHVRMVEKGPDKVSAFTIPKLMVNAGAANIAIRFGAKGPSTAVATACASAANAMGDAMRAIQHGTADVVFTGGSEAALTPLGLAAFSSMKALSTRNDDPATASRPFDRDRDGFVMAEGAGILVFEEYEHAQKRNARAYAEVLGFGMSGDACHIAQPDDNGDGAALAMRAALADAGLAAEGIDYVNAHGTSTPLGDIAETRALRRVFGEHAKRLAVSSTKSSVGHLLGASGGLEMIATCLTLQNDVVAPTINQFNPDPECDLDYVPNTPRDRRVRVAMCNSFGFGGHNAVLIAGKPQ